MLGRHVPTKSHSLWRQRVEQKLFQNDTGWPGSGREQGDAIKIKDNVDTWFFMAILSEKTNYGKPSLFRLQPFEGY